MYKNYKTAGDLGAAKETASSKFTKGFILIPTLCRFPLARIGDGRSSALFAFKYISTFLGGEVWLGRPSTG